VKWYIEETGTPGESSLVITVTKKEQRRLRAYLRRDRRDQLDKFESRFDSDDFLYDLLQSMFTDDCFTWLPDGTTGDMTSAPMIGILGGEMPGPPTSEAECSGLDHCGRWEANGALREMYRPVLQRWAFLNYAVTGPQHDLAETGRCEWQGGEYWASQEAAGKAVAEFESRKAAAR
jgi:hypothetical protein